MRKQFYVLFIIICSLMVLVACQNNNDKVNNGVNEDTNNEVVEKVSDDIRPVVTMTMENGGVVTMELYPSVAPNTVNNFISLIEDGFYDGLIFHRVIPGFMIQGGDPEGTGMGGPGYMIPGEFETNGYENDLTHERGVLSMARSQSPDSAGSQFFIMTEVAEHLDGDYAAFGKVVDGMDVVDDIVNVEADGPEKSTPIEEQVIKSMTVDLKGYEPAKLQKK